MKNISRRQFLTRASGVLLCACTSFTPVLSAVIRELKPFNINPSLTTLPYSQVSLTPSKLQQQFHQQSQLYLTMSNDALLKPFRQRVGLKAPGEDMGGWYDDSKDFHIDPSDWSTANWHGYIPGHSFGQYISGLSRAYAANKNPQIKVKIEQLLTSYSETISPKFFKGYPLPAYTYDKIAIGLIDAYQYVGLDDAKIMLDKLTDVVLPFLPNSALTRAERRQLPYTQEAEIWDEPYTLPENLFIAWRLGMGERYKGLALQYMQDKAFFDPLAKGECPFKGRHAYSHINALNSAVQAYLVTGEKKYFSAAKNGFDFMTAQSYATGAWGPNEELLASDDTETLYNMLSDTHRSFETPCGVYAHFKIARHLLQLTEQSHYGDSMERVLFNTLLGAKPTLENGDTFYYTDYNHHAHKAYRGEAWPCCSGTFVQMSADYGISAYFATKDKLLVNLYIPSNATHVINNERITVSQQTRYPLDDKSSLTITVNKPTPFKLALRIPAWAGKNTQITINNKRQQGLLKAGSFHQLDRVWKNNDKVDITFDMPLRVETLNDAHQEMLALMTGPLVLFPIEASPINSDKIYPSKAQLLSTKRLSNETWQTSVGKVKLKLKPFVAINEEQYRLYNDISLAKDNG
ncbi:MAG: glycoside hydrolase family 127 protein [Colwellia sp.]